MSVPNNILPEVATVKNRGPSECSICYRPANGHHCGVASCKGCKTFFRRQCLSNSEINCKLNQDCFDIERKKLLNLRCQACRFKKCIAVGMNPLALTLKDNEKEAGNLQKILKNKQTKELEIFILYSEELQFNTLIDKMIYLDEKIEQFRISEYNPSSLEFGTLEDMIKRENQFSFAEKFKQMPGWPMQRDEIQYNPIPERSKVRNIPDSRPLPFQKNIKNWMFFNILMVVEYMKTFKFFHQLDLCDKQILAGHVVLMCMNFHNSYFTISKKVDGCLQPDGSEEPSHGELHYSLFQMPNSTVIRLSIQPIEFVLLKAICVCNPTVHGLSIHAQKVISEERHILADVLLDYCLRSQNNGPARFGELLGIITVLENQQRYQKDIYMLYVSPVVAEYGNINLFFKDIMASN